MISKAKWIKSTYNQNEQCLDFYLNKTFGKPIKKAVLKITSLGFYRAFINKHRVGLDVFTPYFTSYIKRTQYQTYDVTNLISGKTEISILTGEGWAVGEIWGRNHYSKNISLIFALEVEYKDGSKENILSDENVKVRTSYIISSSIYHGECVDKTSEIRELGSAVEDCEAQVKLIEQEGEYVREQDFVYPVAYMETPRGERVIDFGQNMSGYVEIRLTAPKGSVVKISHAEVLDKDGNFYNENFRAAKATNTYIFSGEGEEMFKPTFSWQGFRYIRLDEYPFDIVDLSCFKAISVHSDMVKTSDFCCGNSKINQLYHNTVWGQKSNFIDIPTDCPQRDERTGWVGDVQVFVKTAAINYDVEKFFMKWLKDLAVDQFPDGAVTMVVPSLNKSHTGDRGRISAAWGDAATICPWEIYMAYGNQDVLKNQFTSMKKWVDYIHLCGEEEFLWIGGDHYGDWLGMDSEEGSYVGATDKDYIASAFFKYSTYLVICAGKIIGEDVSDYERLYENIKKAFKFKFTINGVPNQNTQTAYALALCFDLVDDRVKTAKKLNDLVKEKNGLTTGFVGTPYLLYALSDNGYTKTAYDLLLNEENPSWLYSVNKGATTMWEHWDGIKEDGTFWSKDMNSFNHYAYGAVYSWMFNVAGGISPKADGAGYSKVKIEPHTDIRLGFLKTYIDTKFGRISSYWYHKDDKVCFEFSIPQGVEAEIILPNGVSHSVTGGMYLYNEDLYNE